MHILKFMRLLPITAAVLIQQPWVNALTVFSDGGTHIIQDASYRNEAISVSDNAAGQPTTLIFETGAVYDEPGAVLSVHGGSRLIIHGGQFGGASKLTGQLFAFDESSFEIHGGSFGGSRLGSGALAAHDNAQVKILGGAFGATGSISGAISAASNAHLEIHGGSFGGIGGFSGAIFASGDTHIEIHGGSFQSIAPSGGKLFLSGNSATDVLGCNFAGYPNYGQVTVSSGILAGTLEKGGAVNIPFQRVENAVLTLVNACDSDGDGIPDVDDSCSESDTRATVFIGDCDTGVPNTTNASGCTLADQIAALKSAAKNHGKFVSSIAEFTNSLRKSNAITEADKAALRKCAAQQKP